MSMVSIQLELTTAIPTSNLKESMCTSMKPLEVDMSPVLS